MNTEDIRKLQHVIDRVYDDTVIIPDDMFDISIGDIKIKRLYCESYLSDCEYIKFKMQIDDYGMFEFQYVKHKDIYPFIVFRPFDIKECNLIKSEHGWQIMSCKDHIHNNEHICFGLDFQDVNLVPIFHHIISVSQPKNVTVEKTGDNKVIMYDHGSVPTLYYEHSAVCNMCRNIDITILDADKLTKLCDIVNTFTCELLSCVRNKKDRMTIYETVKMALKRPSIKGSIINYALCVGSIFCGIGLYHTFLK